jgi:hypothetical protein
VRIVIFGRFKDFASSTFAMLRYHDSSFAPENPWDRPEVSQYLASP